MKTGTIPFSMKLQSIGHRFMYLSGRSGLAASVMVLFVMTFTGCTTMQKVKLPPVSQQPTDQSLPGKFVWFDLLTEDVPRAKSFYAQLFGWKITPSEEDPLYFVIRKETKPIGGMVAHENRKEKSPESLWLMTMSVHDVDQAAAAVKDKGGKVLQGPVDAVGRGRMVLVSDPAGAPLILLRASGGDPADAPAATGELLWNDLFTQNAKPAGAFYEALAGYKAESIVTGGDYRYFVLKKSNQLRAGIVEVKWKGLEDTWVPYIKVDTIDGTIDKAQKSGAKLLLQDEDAAILRDPTGAVFGIHTL